LTKEATNEAGSNRGRRERKSKHKRTSKTYKHTWRPDPSSIWEMAMTEMVSAIEVQIRIWARAPDLTATSWAAREVTSWMSPVIAREGRKGGREGCE